MLLSLKPSGLFDSSLAFACSASLYSFSRIVLNCLGLDLLLDLFRWLFTDVLLFGTDFERLVDELYALRCDDIMLTYAKFGSCFLRDRERLRLPPRWPGESIEDCMKDAFGFLPQSIDLSTKCIWGRWLPSAAGLILYTLRKLFLLNLLLLRFRIREPRSLSSR